MAKEILFPIRISKSEKDFLKKASIKQKKSMCELLKSGLLKGKIKNGK